MRQPSRQGGESQSRPQTACRPTLNRRHAAHNRRPFAAEHRHDRGDFEDADPGAGFNPHRSRRRAASVLTIVSTMPGSKVIVCDGEVGTAETTLGEPRHAAHIRLSWGHFGGIRAANRHASGTFQPENTLRGRSPGRPISRIWLRSLTLSSIRPMGRSGQDRSDMPLLGPNPFPNCRRGNDFDPVSPRREQY